MASSTSASVPGSRVEVASSSTSTAGSASAARASDTSCFSPADRREPRSCTSVSSPSGSAAKRSTHADGVERRVDLGVGGVGPADAHVVADRAAEQEALLRHDARCAGAATLRAPRRAGRRRRRSPCRRSGRRGGRSAWPASTCPAPVGPDQREPLARRDRRGRRRASTGVASDPSVARRSTDAPATRRRRRARAGRPGAVGRARRRSTGGCRAARTACAGRRPPTARVEQLAELLHRLEQVRQASARRTRPCRR